MIDIPIVNCAVLPTLSPSGVWCAFSFSF